MARARAPPKRRRSRTPKIKRRRIGGHPTVHVASAAGALATGYGIALQPPQPGWAGNLAFWQTSKGWNGKNAAYNVRQSIPVLGNDPNMAGNRATVGAGLVTIAAAKLAPSVAPSLRKIKLRLGRGRSRRTFALVG